MVKKMKTRIADGCRNLMLSITTLCFVALAATVYASIDENFVPEAEAEPARQLSYLTYEMEDGERDADLSRLARTQENTIRFLTEHFERANPADIRQAVLQAFESGRKHDIDPMLILAIIAVESSFNPKAKSPVGALGLMQVHVKVHRDKFKKYGGVSSATQITPAIEVGTQILKEYVVKTGSLSKGLKIYVGAANHNTDQGYGSKVLTMRNNIQLAALGDVDQAKMLARSPGGGNLAKSAQKLLAAIDANTDLINKGEEEPRDALVE